MRDHVLIHNNEDNYEELFEWVYFILVLVRYSIFGSTKIDSWKQLSAFLFPFLLVAWGLILSLVDMRNIQHPWSFIVGLVDMSKIQHPKWE